MRPLALPALTLLAVLSAPMGFNADARITDSILQIGIVPKANQVVLRPEGQFSAVDQETGEAHALQTLHDYKVEAGSRDNLSIGPFSFRGQVRLLPHNAFDLIRVGSKRYRGNFILRPNADRTLSVISEIGIEEYLYGVLPAEMSPDWPLEALKAQAVVARTFALNNLDKFRASGFDLSGDSRSQAYADIGQQSENVIRAVKDTQGEVLSWNGNLLEVYFHSCCGGHTASADAVWGSSRGGKPPRPLRGISDRYCSTSPQYQWKTYFSSEDIQQALEKHGVSVARIRSIRPGKRDWSGFLDTLSFSADGDRFQIKAKDFRDWLGNTEIKSTKILKIAKRKHGFEFSGRGFGHGVGLCQWGAYSMAQHSKSYRKILAYYFPGAKIATSNE